MNALASRGITLALPSAAVTEDQAHCETANQDAGYSVESGDLQPPGTTAERADRPVERYTSRIDPPDPIAGGATTREQKQ
jgi:hypothetical protein